MLNIGFPEMILILVLALIVFGPKKLPEVGKAVGSALKEFKKAASDIQETIRIEEVAKLTEKEKVKSS
ncbi:twin-arginine translocase TatA/TatE family subunit [Calderihabitans maritimus]|uniref:Sec-independent protein translocase protein TatA n=1 Tax=Calderihabitans maritimus TaxID=1246530 RepID=A0A1Z5HPM9_9FIRM|nr:twin-arginine translocase TatA/TatE family subunit [Calderihabitans maritimus]GAW91255.1 twin-arginine translocation proteinTatA/E family subunit [Calderihabitans maritimus]